MEHGADHSFANETILIERQQPVESMLCRVSAALIEGGRDS
jgi:hypothetical protein